MHPIAGTRAAPEWAGSNASPPFWIIVFSDVSGDAREPLEPLGRRALIDLEPNRLEAEMERLGSGLRLTVQNRIADDGTMMAIDLAIRSLADFEAESLISQVPALRSLQETRVNPLWMTKELENDTPFSAIIDMLIEHDLLSLQSIDRLAADVLDRTPGQTSRYERAWDDVAPEAKGQQLLERLRGHMTFAGLAELALAVEMAGNHTRLTWCLGMVAEYAFKERHSGSIDRATLATSLSVAILSADSVIRDIVSRQLAAIVHHPKVRQLEAAWRGLHHLTNWVGNQAPVKISLFNMTRRELVSLCRQELLGRVMWQRMRRIWGAYRTIDLHDEAHWQDMPIVSGQPIGMLVGDYSFDLRSSEDLNVLQQIACLARDLQAPVVVNLQSGTTDDEVRSDRSTDRPEQSDLDDLIASGAAHYLALAAPPFLARLPQPQAAMTALSEPPYSQEDNSDNDRCWSGAAMALAAKVALAVSARHWTSSATALEQDHGEPAFVGQPQIAAAERHRSVAVLARALPGVSPAFLSTPMVNASGCAVEHLALRDMILASRIAHCLRLVARQCATGDPAELQTILTNWIDQHVVSGRDSRTLLFAEPALETALICVGGPQGLPRHAKGILHHPQYFGGTLHLVLAPGQVSDRSAITLGVTLYRRPSARSRSAGAPQRSNKR